MLLLRCGSLVCVHYFRFRFCYIYSHRHAILQFPPKFRNNPTIAGVVVTSYRVFKMAAIQSEIYFRVQIS